MNDIQGKEINEFTTFEFLTSKGYYDYQNGDKYYQSIDHYLKAANKPLNILFVAEKPMIARVISQMLGHTTKTTNYNGVPSYNFRTKFRKADANVYVTSVKGHIYSKDFPTEFRNEAWNKSDPKRVFDMETINLERAPMINKYKKTKKEIPVSDALTILATDIDILVLWLDCDSEGENICFEVINVVKDYMKTNIILRANFSSLAAADIQRAYQMVQSKLSKPNIDLSLSVNARKIIDLKVGVSMTRLLTNSVNKRNCMISYGPCQTPTLNFIVKSHIESSNSKSIVYHTSSGSLKDFPEYNLKWSKRRLPSISLVPSKFHNYSGNAEFVDYEEETINVTKPYAMNTVDMLQQAVQKLKIGSSEVMELAEHLYLSKLITYPRTETTRYPQSDIGGIYNKLDFLNQSGVQTKVVSNLYDNGIEIPNGGINMGDHPPIMPTLIKHSEFAKNANKLSQKEWDLYMLIVNNYLASYSKGYSYKLRKAIFTIEGETFYIKEIIEPIELGFTKIIDSKRKRSTKQLPNFQKGEKYSSSLKISAKNAKRKGSLTESELINLMDKNKIGTDASIPVHIIHLLNRGYARINSKNEFRELIPTKAGEQLIQSLEKVNEKYVLPEMRATIEAMVKDIADGKQSYSDVLKTSLRIFYNHYCLIESQISEIAKPLRALDWTSMNKQTSKYIIRRGRRGRRGTRRILSE
jgi:DNA topoisomerase III